MSEPDPCQALQRLHDELRTACHEAGQDTSPPEIVAVSKKHASETIRRALECGHRLFGENRVQEAYTKWPELKAAYQGVRLHLIGPLQSNKVNDALGLFDVIETVDREKIARAIAKGIENGAMPGGRPPDLYVQVNTGEEPQKSGIAPHEATAFVRFCRDELGLPVIGLMCIPPIDEPPAPHFALLAKVARESGLARLSMGMSADYTIAAQLGATSVRIGSGVFGPRPH